MKSSAGNRKGVTCWETHLELS